MIGPGARITHFRLREPHRQRLLDTEPRWGHGGLSEVTFFRTYSRPRPDGTQESWGDCVVRVIEGMFSVLRTHADLHRIPWREERGQRLALEAAQRMATFRWTPPGRGLWMMGTDYMWERGGAALNNCAFVSTEELSEADPEATVGPFRFLMDSAMMGIGPGFDTRGAGKIGVRGYEGSPVVHRVADSREGWVDVVADTLRSLLLGGPPIVPDVQDVRPLGAPLRGFGGVASGPLPLLQGLRGLEDLLLRRVGQPLDSVTIVDIMNVIGKVVVAGNIRRTAEIGFAEPGDEAFGTMKDWRTHGVEIGSAPPPELLAESPEDYAAYAAHLSTPETGVTARLAERYADRPWAYKLGGWRWASNNSLRVAVGTDYARYDEQIAATGEPGFFWEELARSHGRLRDPANHRDHRVKGANPCVEQSLESYEMCNLVENFPSHAEAPAPRASYDTHEEWVRALYWDFQRSLKFSYLYAKTVTLVGTHVERTNEIISRNRRIGCSMSGVADAVAVVGRTTFLQDWCERAYAYVGYLDKKYSDWLGVRESVKRTSMKPSGTVSLLAGVYGPGAHYPKSTGYRLMRLAAGSSVAAALVRARYRVEPAVTDPTGTVVAYFPWLVPEGVLTEEDAGLWEQVRMAADLQHWWADNQVSYTATFTAEEAARGEISRVLTAHDGQLKGISFLPKDTGAVYAQMPFTRAPRAEVERYAAGLLPLGLGRTTTHEAEDRFCDGQACEVPGLGAAGLGGTAP